jgi:hypothetical protein
VSNTIRAIKQDAPTLCDEVRYLILIDLEILLFNTRWWELERQYKLRKLIRIYRKGLTK